MAEDDSRAPLTSRTTRFNGRASLRLGMWSLAACVAVMAAVAIANSETGLRRFTLAISSTPNLSAAPPRDFAVREVQHKTNEEMQRLSETLRQVNADRVRLTSRLEAIERHLDDLTGSINRGATAAPGVTAENGPPPPAESPPPAPRAGAITAPSSLAVPVQQVPPAVVPQQSPAQAYAGEPPPAEAPPQGRVDFGVDLGAAQTVDGLRVLWAQTKSRHGALLEGLRPIVTIRETSRPGATELRLVAGPIPSATLAARLCVTMHAAGAVCQPAVFDGQRLALR